MSMRLAILCIVTLAIIGIVAAADFQVMVVETSIDPPVLMSDDTGIIKIRVVNNGDSGVSVNRATLFGGEFSVTSDPYPTVGWIGAGNYMDFTYTVTAEGKAGIYYPRFVLEYSDGTTLRYAIPVQVDTTDLTVALVEQPDYVAIGKTTEYRLLIANPRPNAVESVLVIPEGTGLEATPSRQFIGNLGSNEEVEVSFNITPERITQVKFRVVYKNGINPHDSILTLPILPTENKKGANPLISNVQVSQEGGVYRITGDVSNAGLRSAKSVVIRTEAPAIPADPFKIYVVGSLEPDDFSSFEVSFKLPSSSSVPLIVEYKDDDGNKLFSQTDVDVDVSPLSDQTTSLPVIGTILVWLLVLVIGAAIIYSWRKR